MEQFHGTLIVLNENYLNFTFKYPFVETAMGSQMGFQTGNDMTYSDSFNKYLFDP